MSEATRGWIYRAATALGAVGVAFGLLTESKAASIVSLLVVLTNGLATRNTSTIKKEG